ncbi:MAG: 2-oxoacid:acceptor oxidoreductase subunit alpha [Thaumarchaeota archaeon]|nr:2-oxoacid:acceptor oxidoreductase subunit alpha [Nitrososphaerota archaeon]
MIGGPQGSGVDSSANVFARACTMGGLFAFGKREYYSNVMGQHSYFQVRVDSNQIRSHVDPVDILTTFDTETVVRHAHEVTKGGAIIYDKEIKNTNIAEIPTLEEEVSRDLRRELKKNGMDYSVFGLLDNAKKSGTKLYPIPYSDLLKEVGDEIHEPKLSRIARIVNVMAVSASLSLLKFPEHLLHDSISRIFGRKPKVVETNIIASKKVTKYVRNAFPARLNFSLGVKKTKEPRIYLQGDQAVAMGKLLGGCRFQSYYPITPASDESVYMENHQLVKLDRDLLSQCPDIHKSLQDGIGSALVMQAEDEIAAINMAIGAGLAGTRAATSTSGPGFSLMVEGLGWSGMNEVPLVVTLYQRAGPSTGLPTRTEQGDLQFALYASHGEFPRIVLASGDHEEAFYDAARAFNYSEKYQLPVIHLIDKALANSSGTFPLFRNRIKIDRGRVLSEKDIVKLNKAKGTYKRFSFTEAGVSPRVVLGTRGTTFWNTGDEHDEVGHISEHPENRTRMMDKRMGKIALAAKEIPYEEKINSFGDGKSKMCVISWGSTKGAILDAMEILKDEGEDIDFIQIRMLKPLASKQFLHAVNKESIKICIEMNYSGQLASYLRSECGIVMDHLIVKYNGRAMSCDEIVVALKKIRKGNGAKRMVLTYGT